jgi:hypothetical protein
MSSLYRNGLPQLDGGLSLTDGREDRGGLRAALPPCRALT